MRHEDKELSKYSKYKARVDLTKIRQVASVLALLARSLGLCWGGLYLLASARVCLCWLCVRFRTAQVASCHGHDSAPVHRVAFFLPSTPQVSASLLVALCSHHPLPTLSTHRFYRYSL